MFENIFVHLETVQYLQEGGLPPGMRKVHPINPKTDSKFQMNIKRAFENEAKQEEIFSEPPLPLKGKDSLVTHSF